MWVLGGFVNFNCFTNATVKKQKAWFGVLTIDFLSVLPLLLAVKVGAVRICAGKAFSWLI